MHLRHFTRHLGPVADLPGIFVETDQRGANYGAVLTDDGVIIIDDSIAEKPYTHENDIICWHYDHSQDRRVKRINFVTSLYHVGGYSLPVGFRIVAKTEYYLDKKDGKQKRRSPISKNQMYRDLLTAAQRNQIPFRYVLSDVWYSAADNMMFIKHDLDKDFIMPLKANRNVALSEPAKREGRWVRLHQLTLEAITGVEIYLESVDFPLVLVKQVFVNGDGSIGILYLVSSDTTLTAEQITTSYRKRWNVEPYHKSLKQNASAGKIAHSNRHQSIQPSICCPLCLHQARMVA